MNCPFCGRGLEEGTTTFTLAKDYVVYVVRDVPCLQCSYCEHVSFSEDTAKKLEKYTSGKIVSASKTVNAYMYSWRSPTSELPDMPSLPIDTQAAPIKLSEPPSTKSEVKQGPLTPLLPK